MRDERLRSRAAAAETTRLTPLKPTPRPERQSHAVGRLVEIDGDGRPLVDWDGNADGPRIARLAAPGDGAFWRAAASAAAPVLLVLDARTGALPIVTALVRDSVDARHPLTPAPEVQTLDARQLLELRCGKASLELRADGQVTVRGTDVLSRASRTNKIKGGSVQIN